MKDGQVRGGDVHQTPPICFLIPAAIYLLNLQPIPPPPIAKVNRTHTYSFTIYDFLQWISSLSLSLNAHALIKNNE